MSTSKMSVCFGSGKLVLNDYTDEDIDSRKSNFRYLITFSGETISW